MAQRTVKTDQDYLKEHAEQLSDTTRRAKWIARPDEHADHDGQTLATRNRDVIIRWAEERRAVPATIEGTEHGDRPGVLRLDFPGYDEAGGGRLKQIDWGEWFETFDQRDLVFVYQERMKSGKQSNFFKLDSPHREQG